MATSQPEVPSPESAGPRYLEGLNGLRFVAAFFVLVSHAHETVIKVGLASAPAAPLTVFNRGRSAVDFFFTLSGFLITYLLMQETRATGTVSLKNFYLRRACRIWPLYFLVLGIGFVTLGALSPLLLHQTYFDFHVVPGLVLYVLFLPNLMSALYRVGMLNPLWSIGVEEQFYLAWAPLMKLGRRRQLLVVLGAIAATLAFYTLANDGGATSDKTFGTFLRTLRFHYMAVGSLFAWILAHAREAYLRSIAATRSFQWLVIGALGYHYFVGIPTPGTALDLLLALLYGALILSVSIVPQRVVNLERPLLVRLGTISYGIYMFHMTVDYAFRLGLARVHLGEIPLLPATLAYAAALLAVTVACAEVSFRYFESRFIHFRRGAAARAAVPARALSPAASPSPLS
jgi:peptidoglycan/LPS O-acetylase OafA/YrhL